MADAELRLLDLFAGCGGLTAGFLQAGRYSSVGAVEVDRDAASTYAVNFGEHSPPSDIRDWASGSLPRADVVVGGPPCQGFSALGRRNALDPRNLLWREFVEVIRRVRPAFFLLENVPRFTSTDEFTSLRREVSPGGLLEQYDLEVHVLDAADYGSPQARKRAFVVGRPRGMRALGAPPIVPERRVLSDVLADVERVVTTVDLPDSRVGVFGTQVPGAYKMRDLHVTVRASPISQERYLAVPPGGGRLDLPEHLKLPAWRGNYRGAVDVMGRLRWDRPSVTIRTGFFRPEKGRFLHPFEHRPLTHYEAALIQGFPKDYLWCGSKASIARQIGNAVPLPLAKALGSHIARHLL